jgi:hypothetical protein
MMYRLIKRKSNTIFNSPDSYYLVKEGDLYIYESFEYTHKVNVVLFLKGIKIKLITIGVIDFNKSIDETISHFLNDSSYYTCIDDNTYNLIKGFFSPTGLWYYQ